MRSVGNSRRLDVTRLLQEVRNGDQTAVDRLMSVLYADLRQIVRGVMASEGQHHALRPASVVNEAFVGLVQARCPTTSPTSSKRIDWQSRAHFLAIAAKQMRLVLADHTRRHDKKAAGVPLNISLDELGDVCGTAVFDFELVDQILTPSPELDPVMIRILEMDCFGGMSEQEMALVEHVATARAQREREIARNWFIKTLTAKLADHREETGKENPTWG